MELSLLLRTTICFVYLQYVFGVDWWGNYMDGLKDQISADGFQQFPEKSRSLDIYQEAFVCPDMSPSTQVPTRADRVKPADVKVLAAMGDSLTAAIGANATNVLEIPNEYRQFSWSIGGYSNYSELVTLPNIFKLFNPSVTGFAKGMTVSYRPAPLENAQLNMAVTGANTFTLPEQTRNLVDTMKTFPGINMEEDWKVITIFIGSNDLCDYCKNTTLFSADSFIYNLTVSLDILQKEMPRSIVNVVQLFPIEQLRDINDKSFGCILQKFFCSCVVNPKDNSSELLELIDQNIQFQEKLVQLIVTSGRYDGKKDFRVVLQPFLRNVTPALDHNGHIDYSFFTLDCFHLTIKGHEQLAKGLWNNMFQPYGEKVHLKTFSEPVQLICPSKDHPYIYTRELSDDTNGSYLHKVSVLQYGLLLLFVLHLHW
ncbi:phospholipase B1, membrane-associated [Bombina bombina]|uniref:phospholipase B1, membrane-associated n=1 Tax=Bombina bombina TaxID=8345 RepID=UPI00235ACD78|nr:phospholipase B1, membrane-associated [Bombina bombina]